MNPYSRTWNISLKYCSLFLLYSNNVQSLLRQHFIESELNKTNTGVLEAKWYWCGLGGQGFPQLGPRGRSPLQDGGTVPLEENFGNFGFVRHGVYAFIRLDRSLRFWIIHNRVQNVVMTELCLLVAHSSDANSCHESSAMIQNKSWDFSQLFQPFRCWNWPRFWLAKLSFILHTGLFTGLGFHFVKDQHPICLGKVPGRFGTVKFIASAMKPACWTVRSLVLGTIHVWPGWMLLRNAVSVSELKGPVYTWSAFCGNRSLFLCETFDKQMMVCDGTSECWQFRAFVAILYLDVLSQKHLKIYQKKSST